MAYNRETGVGHTTIVMEHIDLSRYHLDILYDFSKPEPETLKNILRKAETDYIKFAHVLCYKPGDSRNQPAWAFRNIGNFCTQLNDEIINACDEYILRRLDDSMKLYFDHDLDKWRLCGEVEHNLKDQDPSTYKYYDHYGRIIRARLQDDVCQEIDWNTGDWHSNRDHIDCNWNTDYEDMTYKMVKPLIEKEQMKARRRLLRDLYLSFDNYTKSIEDQIPDIRTRLKDTDTSAAVAFKDIEEGEYYFSGNDGLPLKAICYFAKKTILCRYNVDRNGVPFWDHYYPIIRYDILYGHTRLYKIPENLISELDLWDLGWDYKRYRVKSLWFIQLKKRATEKERKWLNETGEAAICEAKNIVSSETLEIYNDGITNLPEIAYLCNDAFRYKETGSGKYFDMIDLEYASCPNGIMIYILWTFYSSGLTSHECFLIHYPQYKIQSDSVISVCSITPFSTQRVMKPSVYYGFWWPFVVPQMPQLQV